jgi:lipopolysaccharide/colanic/teichoic acid biosynthesis glycosyltransferase
MNHFETLSRRVVSTRTPETAVRLANSKIKRALDVALSSTALVFLAPFLALVAMAIWVEDGRPALFRQQRTGRDGQPFRIFKFRTMTVAEDGAEVRQATRGDQRVTRVGAILRTLSVDELPQLLNIVRGDMSLVGPRPHALAHDEIWESMAPGYAARFRARPGLTGYAQVNGLRGEIRSAEEIVRRVEADNFYIDNWSLRLELMILLRTVPLLLNDPRAY